MTELSQENLKKINGGGISIFGTLAIVTGVIFIIGVLDGFVRPLSCND